MKDLRCKQCGKPRPDTGWLVCPECQLRNISYAQECELLAHEIRQASFSAAPPDGSKVVGFEYKRAQGKKRS